MQWAGPETEEVYHIFVKADSMDDLPYAGSLPKKMYAQTHGGARQMFATSTAEDA